MKFVPKIYSRKDEKDVFLCIHVTSPPPYCVHMVEGDAYFWSGEKGGGKKFLHAALKLIWI